MRSFSQITGTSEIAHAAATYQAGASALPVRATSQLAINGEKPPKNDALTTYVKAMPVARTCFGINNQYY